MHETDNLPWPWGCYYGVSINRGTKPGKPSSTRKRNCVVDKGRNAFKRRNYAFRYSSTLLFISLELFLFRYLAYHGTRYHHIYNLILVSVSDDLYNPSLLGFAGMMGSRNREMGVKGKLEESKTMAKRMPYEKPTFTLDQIKQAVPPHCFNRSLFRSFSYIVYDLTLSFLFYYIAASCFPTLSSPFTFIAWPIYWILQGLTLTGLWVIAHECGHHAFSDYQWVDDTVGLILHSALLVPYFSWKYSHRRHHSNAGSLERDEVFVPKPKSSVSWYSKYLNNNPLGRALTLSLKLVLGWPLYLAFNVSGRTYGGFASHFNPYGPIYSDRERLQIYISDLGVLATSYVLYRVAMAQGLAWLMCIYGLPLLVVNGCLVTIIYLQHNHPALPHFDSSEWDWLRGALSTVDRDYGLLNKVFHNMTDTHVAHHIFNTMPHYHAKEATKAIKPILGEYYKFDGTPILKALWRETKECVYVEPDEGGANQGVFWYGNKF